MKGAMNKIFVAAAMAIFAAACSTKNDVSGGASGDMGIVAKDIAGEAQKGPFVKGSAVTARGIDCKTMKLTGEVFESAAKSDKGDFTFDDVTLSSTCVVFEAAGKYRDELSGKESAGEITLHALTDLTDRKNVNINVLTELEYERVMYLVTEKGKKFADAKEQAEKEVLASFGIAGDFDNSEDLTIYESGDGNAALLAVSVLMLAKTDEAGFAKRIEKFADSFAETGKWNDDKTKATIEEWQVVATSDGTLDSIRKNVEGWGYADVVPAFEKYVEAFGDDVILSSDSNVTPQSSDSETSVSSSSSIKADAGSEYDATANTLKDLRDGKVYKTVKIGDQVWMAENLNFETAASSCYNDSSKYCDKYGRLYTWATVVGKSEEECGPGKECNLPSGNIRGVCPDGWYLPSEADFETLIKAVGGEKDAGTKLKSTSGWNDDDGESGNGTDAFGFSALAAGISNAGYYGVGSTTSFWGSTECGSEGVPETGNGCAYAMWLDYNDVNVSLRSYAAKDLGYSVRCVKDDDGTVSKPGSAAKSSSSDVDVFDWSIPKEAYLNPDINYGEMTDSRDGQVYKTVKIGNQTWMAENLNYSDSVATPSLLERSWCYNNDPEHCKVGGRLYSWSAAIDSVTLANDPDSPQDCGHLRGPQGDSTILSLFWTCKLPEKVQGICPEGWHLPDMDEWKTLLVEVGDSLVAGKMLKSKTGWLDWEYGTGYGEDKFGFSVIPAGTAASSFENDGEKTVEVKIFGRAGINALFWTSTDIDSGEAGNIGFINDSDAERSDGGLAGNKLYGHSVRCIKD